MIVINIVLYNIILIIFNYLFSQKIISKIKYIMNLPILPFNIISNIYPAPYRIDSDSFNNAVKQYLKIKKNYEINKNV